MRVNGAPVATPAEADHGLRLLDYLREVLGLTGAKEGCGMGECGSCTVIIDGRAMTSCLVLVGQVLDAEIRTVEGLAAAGHGPLQDAFVARQAVQCGYCIPGVLNSCAALLDRESDPSDAQICQALDGNLCRCTAYNRFYDAVHDAAAARHPNGAGA
ncbi:(2Fe-2S)-binding protein [Occultella aeris]|uniref:Nicotinate dehydrogenase small FeS subunit n=1 Tax=Occultella aeris TaxID=2761496 RepID=A0A7M4DRZ0_9MICO|nr:(2Fe-2S)-binding protein [Occultella aeris]VZO40234.1 Nicotinate dehydrogenase small FeS subunit [Occultella aeris]